MASNPNGFIWEDPWPFFRIMAEFVDPFATLSHLGPSVTIFGFARTARWGPDYQATVARAGSRRRLRTPQKRTQRRFHVRFPRFCA